MKEYADRNLAAWHLDLGFSCKMSHAYLLKSCPATCHVFCFHRKSAFYSLPHIYWETASVSWTGWALLSACQESPFTLFSKPWIPKVIVSNHFLFLCKLSHCFTRSHVWFQLLDSARFGGNTSKFVAKNRLSARRWQSTGATQRGQLWPWPGAAAAPPWTWWGSGRGCWNPTTALTEHEAQSHLLCSYQTCLKAIQEEGPKVSLSRARAWWENSAVLLQCGSVDAAQETGNIPFTGTWKSSPGSVDVEWCGETGKSCKKSIGDPEGCLLRV